MHGRAHCGEVAALGTAFLPRLLLGKHPGAGMSISCLTQTTCSPTISHVQKLSQLCKDSSPRMLPNSQASTYRF
ncbi:Hypothetical predicted protein [Marmota monax]|uniref:Uncharacterized protein n=1 Tax=Marmota monax TaxID=9995 RepID=A0A5E4AWP7_MARMO|nr:hypothetical protein GHT09_018362 [Marmota monax]VTJ61181.1 Hypothetical predicted protein [Marmota monax]